MAMSSPAAPPLRAACRPLGTWAAATVLLAQTCCAWGHPPSLGGSRHRHQHDHDHLDGAGLAEELMIPCAVAAATALLSAIGFAVWWFCGLSAKPPAPPSSSSSSSVAAAPEGSQHAAGQTAATVERSRAQRAALSWLGALVAVTVTLLAAQVVLGLLVHSVTLIADSAHGAADAVTYGFSFLVEHAKWRAGSHFRSSSAAERLDALAAAFTTAIVIGTSVYASVDAVHRLRLPHSGRHDHPGAAASHAEDPAGHEELLGPALLAFAIASTLANCGLMAMHRCRVAAISRAGRTQQQPALAALEAGTAAAAALAPPPPPPAPGRAALTAQQRDRRKQTRRRENIAWLHQAFHPSCDPASCQVGRSAGSGSGSEEVAQAKAGTSGAPLQPHALENLNVHGALLHLAADVLRSFVILGAGILMQCGWFGDAARADAVCALLVSACIIAGSLALIQSVAAALARNFLRGRGGPRGPGEPPSHTEAYTALREGALAAAAPAPPARLSAVLNSDA